MVDFRKWLLALAVVGLLLGVGASTANAQGNAFTCSATAVPNIVRAEGVTELLGDLILNCTGGTPTPAGTAIPLQNVVITVGGTNVTSRIMDASNNASEALLLIDEPFPAAPNPPTATPDVTAPATNQLACLAINNTNCAITSVGVGLGAAGSYNGTTGGPTGPGYNVFQGIQQGLNSISWSGVPIDAPGTAGTRIIRITNIRANASLLAPGSSTSLIPTTISESIFVNGYQVISLNQVTNVVGDIIPGLIATTPTPINYQQCNSVNTYLLPTGGSFTDNGIGVTATEGFRYSFKPQNYAQIYSVLVNGAYTPPGHPVDQDVLDFGYNSESGFTPYPPTQPGLDEGTSLEPIGIADTGTQIQFNVAGVGAGVTLYAPSYVYLSGNYGTGTPIGVAVLTTATSVVPPLATAGGGTNGPEVAITSTGTSSSVVYEIWYSDPSVLESLTVPISVEYTSDTAINQPPTTTTLTPATVSVNFYPISTVPTADGGPIPRFVSTAASTSLYTISACTCNLLFPFVTNQSGFDTGIAIANTTVDPFNTLAQTGTVTLNYYGNTPGTTAPVAQYISQAAVPAGQELVFTLSNGGGIPGGSTPSVIVPATAGFQGYIIATANFQYCHGFAFISDVGAQKLAEGYLAISLDIPGLYRTGNLGENLGH